MDPLFSRAYGALAGLALGDALGMPTQAMSPDHIASVYGEIRGLVDADASQPYAPGMPAGSITDDTEQALLVASLLLRGKNTSEGRGILDAGEFAHALLEWEEAMIARGSSDLLGPSTKAALERVRAGEEPLTVGGEGTTNGAAMRVTPIGIATSMADPQAFADAVWSSCRVTHATRQGFQSAALVAAAVSIGIGRPGSPPMDVRSVLWEAVSFVASLPARGAWTPEPDVVAATRRALNIASNHNAHGGHPIQRLAEQIGTSVASAQAVPMAFALAFLHADHLALRAAANVGGDTDTIGAIAGAMIGAVRGVEQFQGHGLEQVEEVSHLDLQAVAEQLLALRAPYPVDMSHHALFEPVCPPTPFSPTREDSQAGRVVLMGQILVDLALRGDSFPHPGGDVWATHEGAHVGGGFNALLAARRMGAEAVSLSPIGEGPNASSIRQALQREGIADAGPRVAGMDNGYCVAFTDSTGERSFISTRGAETHTPPRAWADFVQTMGPLDVLYIDGYLMAHPANEEAARQALRVLPEHVRVVVDPSPIARVPSGLPRDNVILSMTATEAHGLGASIVADRSACDACQTPEGAAGFIAQLFNSHAVIRVGANGAYFAHPTHDDKLFNRPAVTHVPTPSVDAIDTNGAGDAHTGVLAASLALGIPLERGLLLANCAGALSTRVVGPASCPSREEIEAAAHALG